MGTVEIGKEPKEFEFRAIANADLAINYYKVKRNHCPFMSFIKMGLALD